MFGKALRAAFEDDRWRQLDELRWQILRRYGVRSYNSFMAHMWWGWELRVDPAKSWTEDR